MEKEKGKATVKIPSCAQLGMATGRKDKLRSIGR